MRHFFTLLIVLTLSPTTFAEEPQAQDVDKKKTEIVFTYIFWPGAIEGDLKNSGGVVNFETDVEGRVKDSSLGGEILLEGYYGNFYAGISADWGDAVLDSELVSPFGVIPLDAEAERTSFRYWVGRKQGSENLSIHIFVGGEYRRLTFDSYSPLLGENSLEATNHDPFIGARGQWRFLPSWSVETYATTTLASDNESTDYRGGVNYQISDRSQLELGYRRHDVDFITEVDGVLQDVSYKLEGPYVGYRIQLNKKRNKPSYKKD